MHKELDDVNRHLAAARKELSIHTDVTNFFHCIKYFEKKDGKMWFPRGR